MERSVDMDVCKAGLILGIIGFNIFSQEAIKCFPPCRTGYVCHNGECISLCNPPCPSGQKCTKEGECINSEGPSIETPTSAESEVVQDSKSRNIECSAMLVVRPIMSQQTIPGDYEDGELNSAANMIANAVISALTLPSSTIISDEEIDIVKHCKGKLVITRVKSYHKEPARMGQYQGVVRISVEIYNSVTDRRPTRVEEYEAKGGRHWGDSVPLENAFQAVSKKIRRNL